MNSLVSLPAAALPAVSSFLAQTVNGGNGGGAGFALAFPCGFAIIGLAIFALFIWALIDAIQNPRLDSNARLIWILVIIFTSPIGPILYLLIGRKA